MADGDTAMIERPGSPPRRLRACVACTKAKARCNFSEENAARHLCDRCRRMGIVCEAKATKGLRKPRQIKPLGSQVTTLEQKIDGLASRLAEAGPSSASQKPVESTQHLHTDPLLSTMTAESVKRSSESSRRTQLGIEEAYEPDPPFEIELPAAPFPPFNLTWEQATLILAEFKLKFMSKFPFVVFDNPEVTAFELSQDKPFLFRSILLVAAPAPESCRSRMKKEVLAYLGQHLLVKEERTLDLLQGLLVCVAWADFNLFDDHQMTNLTYLAMGYCHNLGLSQIPMALLRQSDKAYEGPAVAREAKMASILIQVHSLEEQRAYLGCFYVMTVNSIQFGRRSPFKGRYIDMCCESLSWSVGVPTDSLLVGMIRLNQLSERISETFGSPYDPERNRSYVFPIEGQARQIRIELDRIAESVSHLHPMFPCFWIQYNYILVRLHEPAIYLTDNMEESAYLYRSQCLFNCLNAANTYFKTLFSLSPEIHLYRTFASAEHIQFVIVLTTRILLLESDGWDLDIARMTLNFPLILDRLISQLKQASEIAKQRVTKFVGDTRADIGDEVTGGKFAKYVRKLEWIKSWYSSKVMGETAALAEIPPWFGLEDENIFDMSWFNPVASDTTWAYGLSGHSVWNFDTLSR